jgi:hypothetical protein
MSKRKLSACQANLGKNRKQIQAGADGVERNTRRDAVPVGCCYPVEFEFEGREINAPAGEVAGLSIDSGASSVDGGMRGFQHVSSVGASNG